MLGTKLAPNKCFPDKSTTELTFPRNEEASLPPVFCFLGKQKSVLNSNGLVNQGKGNYLPVSTNTALREHRRMRTFAVIWRISRIYH